MSTMLPTQSFRFKPISPAVILADPDAVRQATTAYLHQTMPNGPSTLSDDHPTPEGLARALGFSSFQHMRHAIERRLADPNNAADPDFYDSTIHTILAACSDLQDYYLKHGLSSTLNTAVAKFISSAYFRVNETKESTVTTHNTEERTITIKIASSSPTTPEGKQEINRLTQHLEEQTRNELQAMNKTERRLLAPAVTIDDII